jgi:hypothetical protein
MCKVTKRPSELFAGPSNNTEQKWIGVAIWTDRHRINRVIVGAQNYGCRLFGALIPVRGTQDRRGEIGRKQSAGLIFAARTAGLLMKVRTPR